MGWLFVVQVGLLVKAQHASSPLSTPLFEDDLNLFDNGNFNNLRMVVPLGETRTFYFSQKNLQPSCNAKVTTYIVQGDQEVDQSASAKVTIRDPSGSVVREYVASISDRNITTYQVEALQPGRYTVEALSTGPAEIVLDVYLETDSCLSEEDPLKTSDVHELEERLSASFNKYKVLS